VLDCVPHRFRLLHTAQQCLLCFDTPSTCTIHSIALLKCIEKMLMVMKPNGEVDVEISPRIIVGPAISLDASSVTDFTYHSAPRSIMTNYDYTQYDAAAAQMEATVARDDAELEEYGSILDDGGFGIHKSRPVADDEFGATNTQSRQVEEWESVSSKRSVDYSIKSKHSSGIHAMHRRSSDISIKSKRSFGNRKMKIDDVASEKVNKMSSGSNIRRLLFRGKKAKSGINAIKETHTATPDTDASSRQLEPSPFSNNSFTNETQTPLVTNSSVGRRTPSLVEPPFIPISIASPHIAPRKERSILRKIAAMKEDEGSSASTARLTDDDTISEGDTNSANATREPKETVVESSDSFRAVDDAAQADDDVAQKGVQNILKENDVESPDSYCSVDAVNNAAQKIFRENVINYNTFFSCPCSGDAATEVAVADDAVSVAISSSTPVVETESKAESKTEVVVTISSSTLTPVDETVSKIEIGPSLGVTVQPEEGKEAGASGLACINEFDTSKLSYDFYEGSLLDDEESVVIGSARSFDSMDSLSRRDVFACDPCGIGGLMDDVSDAIQDIMRLRKGTSPDSHDDESIKPRRKESFLRYQEQVLSQRRLT